MTHNEKIVATLSKLGRSGEFATDGSHSFSYIGLVVKGVGEIAFPLPKEQALRLIEQSHKAPFGKGSDTLVDESVRKTWEINAEEVQLNGPDWPNILENIMGNVKRELGLEDMDVRATLYKLLIYEPGGFFKQHKDSEKGKGMFGTLVVALPSVHEGGEINAHFGGRSKTLKLDEPASKFQIGYAAFYADCDHEISPVVGGYRLTLVFNLVQNSINNPKKPVETGKVVSEIVSILQQKDAHSVPLVYLLGHQYTPENFGENCLKLDDRMCAHILLEAAAEVGLFAQLCLVTHYMTGELEPSSRSRSYRGRRHWDEDEDVDAEDGEMGEVHEQSSSISHWDKAQFPGLGDDYAIFDAECINELDLENDPLRKEAEGYTGNAGMTMNYWYHFGAIFFWSPSKHPAMVAESDPKTVLDWLKYHLKHWDKDHGYSQQLAKNIVQIWANTPPSPKNRSTIALDTQPLVAVLAKLDDPKLLKSCTNLFAAFAGDLSHTGWWTLHSEFRKHDFIPIIEQYLKTPQLETVKYVSDILVHWGGTINLPKQHQRFFEGILDRLPKYLNGLAFVSQSFYELHKDLSPQKFAIELMTNVLCVSKYRDEDNDWQDATMGVLINETSREYVNEVVIAALWVTEEQGMSGSILYEAMRIWALDNLLHRVENQPQPPADWTRTVPQNVYRADASKWALLREFMESPIQTTFDYRAIQRDRGDMAGTILRQPVDLSFKTIKKGSPHILRLTKTTTGYDNAMSKWKTDVALMEKILASNV